MQSRIKAEGTMPWQDNFEENFTALALIMVDRLIRQASHFACMVGVGRMPCQTVGIQE